MVSGGNGDRYKVVYVIGDSNIYLLTNQKTFFTFSCVLSTDHQNLYNQVELAVNRAQGIPKASHYKVYQKVDITIPRLTRLLTRHKVDIITHNNHHRFSQMLTP